MHCNLISSAVALPPPAPPGWLSSPPGAPRPWKRSTSNGSRRRNLRSMRASRPRPMPTSSVFRIPIKDATIDRERRDLPGMDLRRHRSRTDAPRARVGDQVRVTVVNDRRCRTRSTLHAARIPANVAYRMIQPKDSVSFEFTARDAGAFMVHCGTPPVTMHLMQGMYLPIIVDPKDGWGTKADKEFVLVQSEFYAKPRRQHEGRQHHDDADASPTGPPSRRRARRTWRSTAARDSYRTISAARGRWRPRALLRGECGPELRQRLPYVGAIFDRVYPDGNPETRPRGCADLRHSRAGGAVFEAVFGARRAAKVSIRS